MHEASTFPLSPPTKKVAQKFHFAILRIEVTRAWRVLSAIAELLVNLKKRRKNGIHIGLGPNIKQVKMTFSFIMQ